jgi:hypothetical protein
MRGGHSTFSGKTPTVVVIAGRPSACASTTARPVSGGSNAATTMPSPANTNATLRSPPPTSSRAASITVIWPFRGAIRLGTSTTRVCGRTPQLRRNEAMWSALTAAGLNVAVSTARGITVMRSGGIL